MIISCINYFILICVHLISVSSKVLKSLTQMYQSVSLRLFGIDLLSGLHFRIHSLYPAPSSRYLRTAFFQEPQPNLSSQMFTPKLDLIFFTILIFFSVMLDFLALFSFLISLFALLFHSSAFL